MKNKALEGQSGTIGDTEKQAIVDQLNAYSDEIDSIVEQTQWNGTNLIGQSGSVGGFSGTDSTSASSGFNFLTSLGNDNAGHIENTTSNFAFQSGQGFGAFGSIDDKKGLGLVGESDNGGETRFTGVYKFGVDDLTDTSSSCLDKISAALDKVKGGISQVGAFNARLTFKEEAITVQYTNTEAAYSRIMDADMADEQVESSKLTILQQTATAMLSQANTAGQFLLNLFR
jgi:flagellin